MNNVKPFYKSRTFWVNCFIFSAGIIAAIADHLAIGGPISGVAFLNILLRFITVQGITIK